MRRKGLKKASFVAVVLVFSFISLTALYIYINGNNKSEFLNKNNVSKMVEAANTSSASSSAILSSSPTPTLGPQKAVKKNIFIGVVVNDYKNSNRALSALEERLGINIKTISIFKQFGNQYNKDFVSGDLDYAKSRGMNVQVAWEPWDPAKGSSQEEDYLSGISQGKYDEYIRKFAQDIKSYGAPVTLRFGHEMNGNWYPWGRRSAEYISAYKHIYGIFREVGVSNVRWMWSINISENPAELASYYPGDSFVDAIGIDGFNFGTSANNGGWRTFTSLFGPTYRYISSSYSKPITISETASSESGGDKANWIKNMFLSELPTSFPKIGELVWFNLLKEADWRIESTDSSLKAFKNSVK